MEEQYREMFDEVRASSRLREVAAHMTTRERKPSRRRLPKAAVAEACGVSEGKVKMSLHRTRKKLREFLQKEGLWQ